MTHLHNTIQIEHYEEGADVTVIVDAEYSQRYQADFHNVLTYSHRVGSMSRFSHSDVICAHYEITEPDFAREIEEQVQAGKFPYLTLIPS